MSVIKKLVASAAPLALLAVGACASPFRADVARFQALPVPQGQTFVIQAADVRNQGGLEFAQYASLVGQRLAEKGYRPVDAPANAALVVTIGYGVDQGKEKVVTRPGIGGYGGFGRWGYPRFGYGPYGYRSAFMWGWNDPFWGGGYPEVDSFTYYTSFLDMRIRRTADDQSLFEGRARARSRDDSLPHLVPNLIEAMFTGFPGNSGEDVKITIPPAPRG